MTLWSLVLLSFIYVLIMRLFSGAPVIDNSVGVWFQGDDPELKTYQSYNQDFGEREWTLLMLETASIYNPAFLKSLAEISARMEQLPHVLKVTSITTVRDNFITSEEELEYRKIYPQTKEESGLISNQQLNEMHRLLRANPVFDNNLIQEDKDTHTVVIIQNDNFIYDPSRFRLELVDAINDILEQYPQITNYSLAGTTVVNAELNRAAERDVYIYYTLISLLLFVFAWLNFHNFKDLIVMFAVVLGSVVPSMGLIAFMNIPYNMITVMLPTILVSLAVAGVVHIINEFHSQYRQQSRKLAVKNAIRQLWKPCMYTTLTTVFGFASLTVSTVEPIFQLGLYAGIGIFLAWITSLTVAPVLLYIFWPQQKPVSQQQNLFTNKLVNPDGLYLYKPIKLGLFICLLIPLLGLGKLETDTNYTRFFDDSTRVTEAYKRIEESGFAQNPISVVIEYPQEYGFPDKNYFRSVLEFEKQLAVLPQVIKIISTNNLLRQIDKAFNTKYASDSAFEQYDSDQISQLLFLGELSANDDLDDLLLKNKSKAQIIVLTPYMSSKELETFRLQIQQLKDRYLPQALNLYVTGTTVLWANMDKQVSNTQLYSLAGISVFLLLMFISLLRSFRLVTIAILVNALPLAITLGIMGLVGVKINIATALIGGITLGVVVDDTIHLFSRIELFLNQGQGIAIAVKNAIGHVGKSIINTTVIIAGGFACLATSSFLPSAQFGAFVTLAIIIALVLDIYIAPILINLLYYRKQGRVKFNLQRITEKPDAH